MKNRFYQPITISLLAEDTPQRYINYVIYIILGVQMRVYGYLRCSTQMQVEKETLANQRDRIQAWCSVNGHELVAVYEDAGLSGSKVSNREGLKGALEVVTKDKGSILCVYSISRLSRNLIQATEIIQRLEKAGCALVSLSEKIDLTTAAGSLYCNLLLCFAQGERAQLQERVKSAMQFRKRQGKLVGTVPFGWAVGQDGETLIAESGEQETLALMQRLSAKGKSLSDIVEALEVKGLRSKKGGPWKRESVRQILKRSQTERIAA
jgi:site-specific DNA recombinase